MSVRNDYLGLIFASMHDKDVHDLTSKRTMGSIPFGGRYRLIDFSLSNFVNSGITDIGIITKSNYGSLLDHVGSGRDWDLARKKHGLRLLPPYVQEDQNGQYKGRLDALKNIWPLLEHSEAKYIICTNCDVITSINFHPMIKQHIATEADITLVYQKTPYDKEKDNGATIIDMDDNGRVTEVRVTPNDSGEQNMWLEMLIICKDKLKEIVLNSSPGDFSLTKYALQDRIAQLKVFGFEHTGHFMRINNLHSYYDANMQLLDKDIRDAMFPVDHPVYTKVGDSAPVKYGYGAKVKNSLIADGCIIEGTVENSILFRGVQVGKGSVVKDSIIMQGGMIDDDCEVIKAIADKNVKILDNIGPGKELGFRFLPKGSYVRK
ncbi:MAG: glucose-1-phosphate adenylyltransferase subunit GlgD [Ruminococcus sp.]|nr:glucose-1-phosphate adenylyltransferase subunit GlgD [Ruminococcus sp.]